MNLKQVYSVAEAAKLLGVQEYRIQYAHRTGKVPSPEIFVGRRLYTWADIQRLARHFAVELPQKEGRSCT